MDLSILDSGYSPVSNLSIFNSCVWTEQYQGLGSFEIVVPAHDSLYSALAPGTHIANSDSSEVGTILTRLVKDDQITVSGVFQLGLLKYRIYRNSGNHTAQFTEYQGTPGQAIRQIILESCVNGAASTIPNATPIPDTTNDNLLNFNYSNIDLTGTSETHSIQFGPASDQLIVEAKASGMGLKMPVSRNMDTGVSTLMFHGYYGTDRSATVVFDSATNTLANVEELSSKETYFNVCYAYAPNIPLADLGDNIVTGVADNAGSGRNWDRRVMMLYVTEVENEDFAGSWTRLKGILDKAAKNALINNNYVRLTDGELVPQVGFQYGVDYFLGDIIGLRGQYRDKELARVTEYIRVQDETGYKEYPTLSIVD